jgi:hypothetical protein
MDGAAWWCCLRYRKYCFSCKRWMSQYRSFYIMTFRHISTQRPKYAHITIERVLQEVFSMLSAPCPLLSNESLNTFPQKQTHGTIGYLLLENGAVNRLSQQFRMFSVGSVQSGYKRVEFRGWQLSWVEGLSCEVLTSRKRKRKNLHCYDSLPGNV